MILIVHWEVCHTSILDFVDEFHLYFFLMLCVKRTLRNVKFVNDADETVEAVEVGVVGEVGEVVGAGVGLQSR